MVDNLTIVIPFYQGYSTLRRLVETLPTELPVIIVDDRSDIPLQKEGWMGENLKILRLLRKGYFAGAVNAGINACKTDVLVLNQDVWFDSVQAFTLIERERTKYAMIGERISGEHPAFGSFGYIHGTFMFMSRRAIDVVGLLNDTDYPLWGNTAEWQWRAARKGFDIHPTTIPDFHHERAAGVQFGTGISHLLSVEPGKQKSLIRTPPLLSVIVPCHNYGRYLEDCLASLIGGTSSLGNMAGQTLQSLEVIIVDDASDDSTQEVMERLVDIKKGIRGYRLDHNQGTAKTLNYGIERACGEFITFLSADDMREENSLEALVRCCQANPHSFAYDDMWLFFKHRRIREWRMDDYDFDRLLFKNHVHAGIVYPKRAWEEVGGYPAIMDNGREDWAFNVALGIHGWCGEHVNEYGYLYRRENQNRSLTNTSPEHHEMFLNKISGLFPEVYRGARPMACCGKGRTATKSPAAVSQQSMVAKRTLFNNGGAAVAQTTSGEMVKLVYTGKGMTSVWDGPKTNARYRFGVDGNTKKWVHKDDAGERGVGGFLNERDSKGNYVFEQEGGTATAAKQPESVVAAPVRASRGAVVDAQVDPTVVVGEATKLDFPNPSDLNASEIRSLVLTKEQWREMYVAELADKNRKSVVTYLEEMIASE